MSLNMHQQCVHVLVFIGSRHAHFDMMGSKTGPVWACMDLNLGPSTCAILSHGVGKHVEFLQGSPTAASLP